MHHAEPGRATRDGSVLRRYLVAGLVAVAPHAAADGGSGAESAGNPVSLSGQIQPLFDTHCVACHQYGVEQAGLDLESGATYANLVGVPSTQSPLRRVEPGAPAQSYLMHKLLGTHAEVGGSGVRMPLTAAGNRAMSASEDALVRQWIEHGAPDN